jgi:hypothetical protein
VGTPFSFTVLTSSLPLATIKKLGKPRLGSISSATATGRRRCRGPRPTGARAPTSCASEPR